MDTKFCNQCQHSLPIDEFWLLKTGVKAGKRKSRCKTCSSGSVRQWMKAGGEKVRALKTRKREARRERTREWLDAKKDAPCTDCKQRFPPCAMQFDHLSDKKKNLAKMASQGDSVSMMEAEIAKCELVCANCHAIRTHITRKI